MTTDTDLFVDNSGTPIALTGGPPARPFRQSLASSAEDRWRNYLSRDQRPAHLSLILEQADNGDPRDLFEYIEEMVEKDLKIRSAYRTRKTALLGLKWEVVPAPAMVGEEELADEIAHNVRRWIESATNLREMRKHQLDGLGKPFAVSWINWKSVEEDFEASPWLAKIRGASAGDVWIPGSFTPMQGRRFRWNQNAIFTKDADPTDQLLYFERRTDREGVPLPLNGTIRSIFNDQSDHPTRAGLLRGFLYPYAFKITALKDWVTYVDKSGIPIRVIKIRREDFDDPDTFELVRASVANLGSNAHGIFPDDSTIEIHAPVGSVEVFKETCDYMDKAFAQAILGHELSSQSSPGPGQLGVTVAENVRQDVMEGDAEDYAPGEKRDLYVRLVGFNYGWDIAERLTPSLKFITEPPKDVTSWVNAVTTFAKTFPDMPVSKQQSRRELKLDVPVDHDVDNEEDAMFAARPAPNPFAGGGIVAPDPNAIDNTVVGDGEDVPADDAATGPLALAASALIAAASSEGGQIVAVKPSQRTVDRIANRAMSSAESELLAMRGPIKKLIIRAKKEGWSHQQLVQAVIGLFDQLPLKRTERLLAQSRTISRIYGRTARAK